MSPAHCSPLSSETVFDADPGFIMEDSTEGIEGGVVIALRLGVNAQMSLVRAMNILDNPTHRDRSPAAVWWLREVQREVGAMILALGEAEAA
jgi:hypothetical protein